MDGLEGDVVTAMQQWPVMDNLLNEHFGNGQQLAWWTARLAMCYHTEVDKLKLKLKWLSLENMAYGFR